MSSSKSYIAVPTGSYILSDLKEKNISLEDFSKLMGMKLHEVECLINGEKLLTKEMATRLEELLGKSKEYYMKLESEYRQNIIKVILENELGIKED